MLSHERQEQYRRRYSEGHPGWQPSTLVYQDLVARHLVDEARALDLGCGRGGVMERLHTRAGVAVGLDPDWGSLSQHRAPGLALSCGVAEALPYGDGTFDLVCSSWVLEHLEDPDVAFGEASRVLTPGGRFVFLTPNLLHPLLMLNRALRWTQGRLVDWLYGRAEPDIFPALYRANTATAIDRLARRAGMERVSVQFIGDPTYLAFNEPLFRFGCVLERVIPRRMRVHLVGEYTGV